MSTTPERFGEQAGKRREHQGRGEADGDVGESRTWRNRASIGKPRRHQATAPLGVAARTAPRDAAGTCARARGEQDHQPVDHHDEVAARAGMSNDSSEPP